MARKSKDVFGFDEFEKAMLKMIDKYHHAGDAFLAAGARQGKKRAKQLTPRRTGNLQKSWREKSPKEYKGGDVIVSLVSTNAPHGHLYEYGHRIVARDRTRSIGGRFGKEEFKLGKYSKASWIRKTATGAREGGEVPGHYVLNEVSEEFKRKIEKEKDRLIDKIIEEVEI